MRWCKFIYAFAFAILEAALLLASQSGKLVLLKSLSISSTPDNVSSPFDVPQEFFWSGGGVQGLSEGMSNAEVDTRHQLFLAAFERHFKSSPSHFLQLSVTKTQTHAFLNLFSNSIAAKGNSDCHLQMSPRSQMLCHLWAAHVHPADSNTSSSLFSEVPLNSLCSLYMSCFSWKRGRYSTRLSASLLESTFNAMRADARLSQSSRLLRRNFVHGIGNTAENDWLTQRLQTSHDVLSTAAGGTVDVRPVFQGGEMTLLDNAADGGSTTTTSFAFRDNGDAVFEQTFPLTVLQTLSILYHRAAGDTSVKVHFPLLNGSGGGGACLVPPLNVLLFSGDSVNHELYRRLLDAIRYGVGPVQAPFSGNGNRRLRTNFSFWPAHDLPNGPDRILAVYPTHDDYFDVHCEMENDVLLRGGKPDKAMKLLENVLLPTAAVMATRSMRCSTWYSSVIPSRQLQELLRWRLVCHRSGL